MLENEKKANNSLNQSTTKTIITNRSSSGLVLFAIALHYSEIPWIVRRHIGFETFDPIHEEAISLGICVHIRWKISFREHENFCEKLKIQFKCHRENDFTTISTFICWFMLPNRILAGKTQGNAIWHITLAILDHETCHLTQESSDRM